MNLQQSNQLIQGEMFDVIASIAPQSIDLLYLDPPFAAGRVFADSAGAFDDRWQGGLTEYLAWLEQRLVAAHQIVAEHGSLFLHLDRRAVHYAKVLLDQTWGFECFRNEIIWHYTGGGRARRSFSHKHDTILWYSKHPQHWTFNLQAMRQPYKASSGFAKAGIRSAAGKRYLPHPDGTPVDDVWDIPMLNPMAAERLGYPTQKPERLLERIILAASNSGDLVADLCCGSGTTVAVAQRLGRCWIAADQSADALALVRGRLRQQAAEWQETIIQPQPVSFAAKH